MPAREDPAAFTAAQVISRHKQRVEETVIACIFFNFILNAVNMLLSEVRPDSVVATPVVQSERGATNNLWRFLLRNVGLRKQRTK